MISFFMFNFGTLGRRTLARYVVGSCVYEAPRTYSVRVVRMIAFGNEMGH